MDLDGLREAVRRHPFKKFAIRLTDGRSLPVSHPEFVAVGARRVVFVAPDDSCSIIDPFTIVSLDYEAGETPASQPDVSTE